MALTNRQAESVIRLFAKTYVNCNDAKECRIIVVNFKDAFSNSIADWQSKCFTEICKLTSDAEMLSNCGMSQKTSRLQVAIFIMSTTLL